VIGGDGGAGGDPPSPAELLDTIRAVRSLGEQGLTPAWADLLRVTLGKPGREVQAPGAGEE
jgi:hypothetical protein